MFSKVLNSRVSHYLFIYVFSSRIVLWKYPGKILVISILYTVFHSMDSHGFAKVNTFIDFKNPESTKQVFKCIRTKRQVKLKPTVIVPPRLDRIL